MSYSSPPSDPPERSDDLFVSDSEVNLSEYVDMLRRHWRLIVTCALLGAAGGLFLYLNTPKTYVAKTRIQIERKSLSPLTGPNSYLEYWWNPEFYPTQYEILKSRGLAERVVRSLELWNDPAFNPTVGQLLPSEAETDLTIDHDDAAVGRWAGRLLGGLQISPVRNTQLVDIIYRTGEPRLAMLVANGVADEFLLMASGERQRVVEGAQTFLESQTEQVKDEIATKERELHNYSRDRDIVAPDSSSNVVVQRLEAATQDYIQARSQRIQREVRYNELLDTPPQTIADGLRDGVISELQGELNRLERDYASNLQTYRPDFPSMVEMKAQIDARRRNLNQVIDEAVQQARDTARAEYQSAARAERALEAELEEMKRETLDLNDASISYNTLRAEIANRKQLLDDLMRRQQETAVAAGNTGVESVRVIERALLPGGPISPNMKRNLMSGLGVGALIGFALLALLEFMDRTIKTPEELERRTGLPTLAVIPDISAKAGSYLRRYGYGYGRRKAPVDRDNRTVSVDLVPQHRPKLAVSEAYRSLRTALLLSTADELKVVVVTSATAGEGKTATAANLATVMAQLGRTVLLIDADLRKPRAHKVLKVSNRVGVVNYLVEHRPIDEILLANRVPNLAVSPSGPTPPNPSELLSSDAMRRLLLEARARFDFVIIDSPPTLAVTDATLLGSMADGVLLCVRAGRVTREETKSCRDRLSLAGVRILGTVLNCYLPPKGQYKRDYYYHYEAYGEATTGHDAVA